jgi:VIT1/CCC1 family predicted Fe2+/Mn2+ transporter
MFIEWKSCCKHVATTSTSRGLKNLMNGLTNSEEKLLLSAIEKIREYKLVQILGFRNLVGKTRNETLRNFLLQVCDEEEERAELLSKRIVALQGRSRDLKSWKTKLLMVLLGIKGVFEWAVMGEELAIQDLALQAGDIRDSDAREEWSRTASEEKAHLERIKTAVLGMDEWETRGGGGLRDIILGANDGLVSTLAFVAGVVGAITNPTVVLLAGIAELFAGTISMATGSYLSSKSELEVWERESQSETTDKRSIEEEKKELIKVYEARFYPSVHTDILEELGLAPKELGNPVKAGVFCGASFGLAALIPILPFAFSNLSCRSALMISIIATLAALFGVGAMKTVFSRKYWIRSGLEMLIIGAGAGAVTYVIGKLFSIIVGV